MQKMLLPAALMNKVILAEATSISKNNLYAVKKQNTESFLHQLFFGKLKQIVKVDTDLDQKWNDPNDFSSYE